MDDEDTVLLENLKDTRLIQPNILDEILESPNALPKSITTPEGYFIKFNHGSTQQYLEYFTTTVKLSVITTVLFAAEFFVTCCSFLIVIRSSQEAVKALGGRLSGDSHSLHYSLKKNDFKLLKSVIVVIMFAHTIHMVLGVVCFYGVLYHEQVLLYKYLIWSAFFLVVRVSFLALQFYNYLFKGYKHMSGIMLLASCSFVIFNVTYMVFLYKHYNELKAKGRNVFEKYQFVVFFGIEYFFCLRTRS